MTDKYNLKVFFSPRGTGQKEDLKRSAINVINSERFELAIDILEELIDFCLEVGLR